MNEKINNFDETPFKEFLQDTRLSPDILEIKSRPDKFIRRWRVADENKEVLHSEIKSYRRGMKMFERLYEEYGINIPEQELIIGKGSKNKTSIFTVIDRIEGESLDKIYDVSKEEQEKIENFYCGLAQFYIDIYQNGGDFWWDFGNRQVVLGHKAGENENKVYIVDVEPRYYSYEPNNPRTGNPLLYAIHDVYTEAASLEKRINPPAHFKKLREKYGEISKIIPRDQMPAGFFKEIQETRPA
ncbi:MAG: hypothetical protein Q8P07_01625 [bacterium]|nr:hypothetical protein [bacterium]